MANYGECFENFKTVVGPVRIEKNAREQATTPYEWSRMNTNASFVGIRHLKSQ